MCKQVHILNGDALKSQFSSEIEGATIIMRECLVDGDVAGASLAQLYETRATFIHEAYAVHPKANYWEMVVLELEKIQQLDSNTVVNLWFEHDLFCQVNLWFILSLLPEPKSDTQYFLVHPNSDASSGFGNMNQADLVNAFQDRQAISANDFWVLQKLWKCYQEHDLEGLVQLGTVLQAHFPFLLPAVNAHLDRIPQKGKLGRPQQTLKMLMDELPNADFATIFQAFSAKEGIYGFGDLQVKRMMQG